MNKLESYASYVIVLYNMLKISYLHLFFADFKCKNLYWIPVLSHEDDELYFYDFSVLRKSYKLESYASYVILL